MSPWLMVWRMTEHVGFNRGPAGLVTSSVWRLGRAAESERRYYRHAMIPLDLDPQPTPEVSATLKRGVMVSNCLTSS